MHLKSKNYAKGQLDPRNGGTSTAAPTVRRKLCGAGAVLYGIYNRNPMKIENFESVIVSESRKQARGTGMAQEDLAQELRLRLAERIRQIEPLGAGLVRKIVRDWCNDLRRRNIAAPRVVSGAQSESRMRDTPTEAWSPPEALEREAEEATLTRLAPDIEAARESHKPLTTVRAGLAKADWIARLIEHDRRFPRPIIETAVDAMVRPVPARDTAPAKAWRADAYRKGAGARTSDYPRGQMATKLRREPMASTRYPTDDVARVAHNRATLAAHFDAPTVERILAERDAAVVGSKIREDQYQAIAKDQLKGYGENAAAP